jgi:hypothetical protein
MIFLSTIQQILIFDSKECQSLQQYLKKSGDGAVFLEIENCLDL